jgi:hypothetical protein
MNRKGIKMSKRTKNVAAQLVDYCEEIRHALQQGTAAWEYNEGAVAINRLVELTNQTKEQIQVADPSWIDLAADSGSTKGLLLMYAFHKSHGQMTIRVSANLNGELDVRITPATMTPDNFIKTAENVFEYILNSDAEKKV